MERTACIQNITNIKILAIKTNSGCEIQDIKCCKNEENTGLKLLKFNQILFLFEASIKYLGLVDGCQLKGGIDTRKEWWEGENAVCIKEKPFPGSKVSPRVISLKNQLWIILSFHGGWAICPSLKSRTYMHPHKHNP